MMLADCVPEREVDAALLHPLDRELGQVARGEEEPHKDGHLDKDGQEAVQRAAPLLPVDLGHVLVRIQAPLLVADLLALPAGNKQNGGQRSSVYCGRKTPFRRTGGSSTRTETHTPIEHAKGNARPLCWRRREGGEGVLDGADLLHAVLVDLCQRHDVVHLDRVARRQPPKRELQASSIATQESTRRGVRGGWVGPVRCTRSRPPSASSIAR